MDQAPEYLRGVASFSDRQAAAIDADERMTDLTGECPLTPVEEAALGACMERITSEIREARRRWEAEQAGGKFR